jgi:transcription antitermination factor NusG
MSMICLKPNGMLYIPIQAMRIKLKPILEKIVENRNMQDYILDIVVPMEEQIEIKDGKKKATLRKVFPGLCSCEDGYDRRILVCG